MRRQRRRQRRVADDFVESALIVIASFLLIAVARSTQRIAWDIPDWILSVVLLWAALLILRVVLTLST